MIGDDVDGYTEGEEPIVFHYKKGDFRKREAKIYSDLATGKNQPKRGFFRVLVNTKGNRLVFTSMVFCFALVFIVWVLNGKENKNTINDVVCELNSFSFDGQVYSSLELKPAKNPEDLSPRYLSVIFEAYDSDDTMINKQEQDIVFDINGEEDFVRVVFTDYNLCVVKCLIKNNDKSINVTSKVIQR